ncbi:regulatory protein RecX [candidate division KSB1 bacterium]|nr:regulatory protein RecX [candidate division KSB1 bacterium]
MYQHHLYVGDEIEESLAQILMLEDEVFRAKNKARFLLSYRMRSIQELKDKLSQKKFSESAIEQVVYDFGNVSLLDDRQFALAYVQTRLIQKPISKNLMSKELRQKGITDKDSQNAIEDRYGGQSDFSIALDLAEKRIRRYKGEESIKVKKKLSDFLARRGFRWDVISEVLGELGLFE